MKPAAEVMGMNEIIPFHGQIEPRNVNVRFKHVSILVLVCELSVSPSLSPAAHVAMGELSRETRSNFSSISFPYLPT